MDTHNNYEPTSRVNYERTTPNPYLHDTYLPPPPPEWYMHQRTGKAWKVLVPVVLLLLGVVVGILFYPDLSGMINPSSLASKPTPYAPFGMPAVTPTANTNYTARDIMRHIISNGVHVSGQSLWPIPKRSEPACYGRQTRGETVRAYVNTSIHRGENPKHQ
jgi:hypothetical protein